MSYRHKLQALLLCGITFASATLLAHTKLESATPADGAALREAPQVLELGFSDEVQLLKVDIATEAGVAQKMDFTPVASAAKTFSVPLPALGPESYVVNWTIVGADGHRVEGKTSFLVDPVAHEPADVQGDDAE